MGEGNGLQDAKMHLYINLSGGKPIPRCAVQDEDEDGNNPPDLKDERIPTLDWQPVGRGIPLLETCFLSLKSD